VKLKLSDIKQHAELQPRIKINDETVEIYANTFEHLPPIVVFQIEGKNGWFLVDGWHRFAAARRLGLAEIEVIKETGGWDGAKEYAFDANIKHGLALSLAERKKATELKLILHTERSNSWIAEECGLSDHTVEDIRVKLESGSRIARLNKLKGRDGKEYPRTIEQPKREESELEEPEEIEEIETPTLGDWPINVVTIIDAIEGLRGLPTESIDLVFTDPPYNLGKFYGENIPDNIDKYWGWCASWFMEICRVLKKGGSFYVMHYPEACVQWKPRLDELLDFRRWITWVYNINVTANKNYRRSQRTILFYSKGEPKHFDGLADGEPYKNPTDKRVQQLNPLNQGVTPTDVWTYQLVKNVSKEKTEWPNQLPSELVERIIKVSSMPNDIVLDPFIGSGTTARAAIKNHRQWIGFDLNEKSKEMIGAENGI